MRRSLCLLMLIALGLGWPAPTAAVDFRIETKIYDGKAKKPASRNTTLFRAGHVYDYLSETGRVVVLDQTRGRFIVLDPRRKLKAEIKTADVNELIERLHEMAAGSSNATIRFAADPNFEVHFSHQGDLTLTSPNLTYKIKTEPATSPEAAEQYHQFSDWYARFNTMANPGSPPPFPRLRVNRELADRGLVPTEVQLLSSRALTARTEHYVSWRLLDSDHRRIAETANQLATFKEVEFDELQTLIRPEPNQGDPAGLSAAKK